MSATMREMESGVTPVDDLFDTGIRVFLERRSHVAPERRHEPVTFGVPFPKGAVQFDQRFCLFSPRQQPVPTQTRVLDRWADDSIRWLLVDAQVDAGDGATGCWQLRPSHHALTPQLAVTEADGALTVSTGVAEFCLQTGGSLPFKSIVIDGEPAIDPHVSGIMARTEHGECPVRIDRVTVEEMGAVRSSVLAKGRILTPTHEPMLDLVLRMHFFAGSPVVRLLLCVRNPRRAEHPNGFWDLGDKGSVYLKDLSLVVATPSSLHKPATLVSVEAGSPFESAAEPVTLYQDSSGGEHWNSRNHINRHRKVAATFRGYRFHTSSAVRQGLRASPIVAVKRASVSVAATMPHFWQNCPKAIEVADGQLVIRLFPGQYADVHEIQGGEQKTHEVFLAFGPDRITEQPLEWCRDRSVPRAEPSWYCSSGAVPYLTHFSTDADRPRVELIESAIIGHDRFEAKREVVDEYGWRHFGDIYGDHEAVRQPGLVSHYNNQYDPVLGFARQFLRSGDIRWWTQMEELARHVVDIDVYHTVEDKWAYNNGLFWHTYHYGDADSSSHRTYPRAGLGRTSGGGPSGEHNYTSGLTLHHFLTGDPTSRETAIASGQYVIDSDDGSKTIFRWLDAGATGFPTSSGLIGYQGPGRGSGNSLNALLDAFRLSGDRRQLDKAEQVIRRCIHPEDDVPAQDLLDAERKWFYTMFLQALGKYLDDKAERDERDAMYGYGRDSLLHYARWMADHERPTLDHPERLEFPTETWAAQDIRKSDVFYHAMKHAPDSERQRFRERGAFFFRYATDTLRSMPTRTLARPVIVLLSSGVLHSWFTTNADAREGGPADTTSFEPRVPFVPQRVIAVQRAKLVAAAALTLVISASLYIACHG